jgi:outer membrane protein assembly factor BamB
MDIKKHLLKRVFVLVSFPLLVLPLFLTSSGITMNNTGNNNSPDILWWYDLSAPSFGSSAVGDIDEDGHLEIVFGTYFNDEHVYALNAENGTLLWKYDTGGCNDASPAIADVDLDGHLEVIIPASSPYTVYCFNGKTGQVKWERSTGYPNCIDSPPAVADVDNDAKPEIIFGTFYGNVFCLNGEDGSICWQINLGTNSYIQSEPDILDVNGDGRLDIVVAQFQGDCRVYALWGNNGSTLWYSDAPQDYIYHGGSFADIDEDGKPEIVIGCYDSHVYVLNAEDGNPVWDYDAPFYIGAPTSIGDLNNDGHIEIVFASYNELGVLSHTGSLLWNYNTGDTIFRGAALADIDGNGVLDVVFGSDDGIFRVLRGDNGQIIWTYDLQAHYGSMFQMDHAPVVADFDNDGTLDVCIIGGYGSSVDPENNYGRIYVLSAGDGTGPGWLMFRHDIKHSGFFCGQENRPPETPQQPEGPINGFISVLYTFTSQSSDADNDQLYYQWDWGDGTVSDWMGPYPSNSPVEASHSWVAQGAYAIKVKAKDSSNSESNWSSSLLITIALPPLPNLCVDSIQGGIGITVGLKNNGTASATHILWRIAISGGFANFINKTINGSIPSLYIGKKTIIKTRVFLGVGPLNVTISATCDDLNTPLEQNIKCFIFLFWVKVVS